MQRSGTAKSFSTSSHPGGATSTHYRWGKLTCWLSISTETALRVAERMAAMCIRIGRDLGRPHYGESSFIIIRSGNCLCR